MTLHIMRLPDWGGETYTCMQWCHEVGLTPVIYITKDTQLMKVRGLTTKRTSDDPSYKDIIAEMKVYLNSSELDDGTKDKITEMYWMARDVEFLAISIDTVEEFYMPTIMLLVHILKVKKIHVCIARTGTWYEYNAKIARLTPIIGIITPDGLLPQAYNPAIIKTSCFLPMHSADKMPAWLLYLLFSRRSNPSSGIVKSVRTMHN